MNKYREELLDKVIKVFGMETKITQDVAYSLETYFDYEPMDRVFGDLIDSITSPLGCITALREDYIDIWELRAMIAARV